MALRFANSVFILIGVFFLALLTHYVSDYQKHWYGWGSIFIYYAMPAAVASLAFAALWLKEAVRINVALVLVFCAVPIYAIESVLAVSTTFAPAGVDPILPDAPSPNQKTALVEFKEMRSRGVDVIPRISPYQWPVLQLDGTRRSRFTVGGKEFWPLGSISNKTVMMCRNLGEQHYITHVTDEHGFNNPHGIWRRRPIEILALGDSQTYGECVPPDKGYASIIRRAFPGTINLGMRGNGPLLMLAGLMEYGRATKPKYVLWFFAEHGDLYELLSERTMPFLTQSYLDGFEMQGLIARQPEIDRQLVRLTEERIKQWQAMEDRAIAPRLDQGTMLSLALQIVKLWNIRNRLGLAVQSYPGELRDENFNLLARVVQKARDETASWGGALVFVYTPSPERYYSRLGRVGYYSRVYTETMKRIERLGVPIVDLHARLEVSGHPEKYFLDIPRTFPSTFGASQIEILPIGHFNELGHATMAQAVVQALENQGRR